MDRPSPSLRTAGHSLVGTLLAVGLLLAMITTGVTLSAATEARHVAAATLRTDPIAARHCPSVVLHEHGTPIDRACDTLTVHNVGDASSLARCEITSKPEGSIAVFAANGVHVYSPEIPAGSTVALTIVVDGAGRHATEIGGACVAIPAARA